MFHILIIVLCLVSEKAFAWNDQVHRMIALIAKEHLNPGVLSEIENLARDVDGEFPPPFDFVEAAYWVNQVSRRGCRLLESWHDEVVFPLNEAVVTLSDPKAGAWEKNFCLRILLYCIGNLHHPLYQEKIKDPLCKLWDGLFGSFLNEYYSEFEDDKEIIDLLQEINWKFPFENFIAERQGKFESWADQTSKLAMLEVYEGIISEKAPTFEYAQRCRLVALKQIALAGYRLSDILNKIFDK